MHKRENIAITGISAITPYGENIEESLLDKKIINLSEKSDTNSSVYISPRQMKKMDKFSALAISSIKSAFDDAGSRDSYSKAGLLIGNIFGGWGYVEDQLYGLYQGDFSSINPYVATAWFPAAPQGEASIMYGYEGYSKTFSSGHLSAAYAIEHGIDMLYDNKLDVVCCGGVEVANVPILEKALIRKSPNFSSVFFCLEKISSLKSSSKIKFTIERLVLSQNIDELLHIYRKNADLITSLIISTRRLSHCQNNIFQKNKPSYYSDEILGDTFGAAFSADLYLGYLCLKRHGKKVFVFRENDDGQYAAALISKNG